ANYDADRLMAHWERIARRIDATPLPSPLVRQRLLEKALDINIHLHLEHVRRVILQETNWKSKRFFLLALLRILPRFSRALPDGGWFRWRSVRASAKSVFSHYART